MVSYVPALSTIFLGAGISFDIHVVLGALTAHWHKQSSLTFFLLLLSPELPRPSRYLHICRSHTGVSYLMGIFLTLYISIIGCIMRLHFAVNAFIRSESAVAATFPLFRVTVQILTNVSLRFSNTDNVGFLIVWACTLIGCIALLFLPSPFLILQIWCARIRSH